ncbi:MAG: alpha/beta hydrolase [Elusimicrobia bacterium]|nr:alpha/beta hydrolase [Elusimicrobiota bacterium]
MRSDAAALVLAALLAGCGHAPSAPPPAPPDLSRGQVPRLYGPEALRQSLNSLLARPFDDTVAVEVLYATNRALKGDPAECDDDGFGVDLSTAASYGLCQLNVPKRRGVGGFEVAPNPRADTHRYFRTLAHESLDAAALAERLGRQSGRDPLVFVHGFNVKFQEAVLRAAQIGYDLKYQGPLVLFSWPAGSSEGILESALITRTYDVNRGNAAKAVEPAAEFFKLLAGSSTTFHVMVHSMGHQVVLPALAKAAKDWDRPRIGELILNAPDIQLRDFQRLVHNLRKAAERITVYCSYNDNAIAASETYNKNRRLGACERVPGVDVVNVGEIDAPALGIGGLGHGYYASRPILTDIHQVLLGIEASKRLFIRRSEPNSTEDYYLRP